MTNDLFVVDYGCGINVCIWNDWKTFPAQPKPEKLNKHLFPRKEEEHFALNELRNDRNITV